MSYIKKGYHVMLRTIPRNSPKGARHLKITYILSHIMRKPTTCMWFLNRSNINRAIRKKRSTILVAKTRALISCAVTVHLCFHTCKMLVFSWRGSFDETLQNTISFNCISRVYTRLAWNIFFNMI